MQLGYIFNTNQDCTQIDLKTCIPINLNTSKITTAPYVNLAVKEFFLEHLSTELYKWLTDGYLKSFYKDNKLQFETTYKGQEKEDWIELVCCARCAIAWYAYYKMLEAGLISLSDAGVTQSEGTSTVRPDEWAYKTSYWGSFNTAYSEMERLIFECLCPNKDRYEQYGFNSSEWCCKHLIGTPKEFAKHQTLAPRGRFYTWLMLRPHMSKVEKLHLKPLLCSLFKKLIKCDNFDDEDWIELQECVCDLVADLTIQTSMAFLNLQPTGHGFKVMEPKSSMRAKNSPDYRSVEHINVAVEKLSPAYYKQLIRLLQANPQGKFSEWCNSKCNPDFENQQQATSKACNCGTCPSCVISNVKGNLLIYNRTDNSNTVII